MSKLCILNSAGDEVLTWDPELAGAVDEATEAARAEFEAHMATGAMWAEKVTRGDDGEVVKAEFLKAGEFDPTAAEIVVHPRHVGG